MKQQQKSTLIGIIIQLIAKIPQPILQKGLVPVIHCILWYGKSELRRITEINIELCFSNMSDDEQKALAWSSLKHTLRTTFEFPSILMGSSEALLKKVVAVDGQNYVDQAEKKGKGLLFISPHLGNWEYLGLKVGQDYPLTSMFKPGRHEGLNDLLHQAREGSGAKLVPTDKKGVMAVLKALKKGEASGILPDQIPEGGNGRVFSDFFSQPAATMTLISTLIKKTDAIAIGCFARRLHDGNFEIIYRPAHPDLYDSDIQISARGLNKTVEALILLAPEQYQWIYKRFRIGPQGKRKIYKKQA